MTLEDCFLCTLLSIPMWLIIDVVSICICRVVDLFKAVTR